MEKAIPTNELLKMQPEEIIPLCIEHLSAVNFPTEIDSLEGQKILSDMLKYTSGMIAYYKQMEEFAKIEKRRTKANGCTREEADRCLAVEEIFGVYKSIFEGQYATLAKMITIKRMNIEEAKIMGTGQT